MKRFAVVVAVVGLLAAAAAFVLLAPNSDVTPSDPADRVAATTEASAGRTPEAPLIPDSRQAAPGSPPKSQVADRPTLPAKPLAAGRIRGRVIDAATGIAIAGARVVARDHGGDACDAPSGTVKDGTFEIDGLVAGDEYAIEVEVLGYAQHHEPPRVIASLSGTAAGSIAMRNALVLTGRVLDEDGRGVAAAIDVRRGPRRFTITTGEDGAFEVNDVAGRLGFRSRPPEQIAQLWVRSEMCQDAFRDVTLAEVRSGAPIEVRVARGAAVSGRCVGVGDAVLAGVEVTCLPDAGGFRVALTDESGRFVIHGLPAGRCRIEPQRDAKGLAADPRSAVVELVAGGNHGVADFVYREGLAIAGRVIDSRTEEPLADRIVTLHHSDWVGSAECSTAGDGTFRFGPLTEGDYTVVLHGDAWSPRTALVVAAKAGVTDLVIRVDRPPRDGTLRLLPYDGPSGRPLPQGTEVELRFESGGEVGRRPFRGREVFTVDSEGAVVVAGLERRWYSGDIAVEGRARARYDFRIEQPDQTVELRVALVPGVTVQGVVTGVDGSPVEGARVYARSVETYLIMDFFPVEEGPLTGEDGRFVIEHVDSEQNAYITAHAPGLAPARAEVAPGVGIQDLVISLTAGATVNGTARHESGGLARHVPIYFAGMIATQVTETDDWGRFTFDAVETGQFDLTGDPDGFLGVFDELVGTTAWYDVIVPD